MVSKRTQIIADASSLILLNKTSLLTFLLKKGTIKTSESVYQEAVEKGIEHGYSDAFELQKLYQSGKIQSVKPKTRQAKSIEQKYGLYQGERDTIALALEQKEALIFCDDKRGIAVCKRLNLAFTTVLDFLVALYETGSLTKEETREILDKLRRFAWYTDWRLKQVEEKINE